MRRPPFTSSPLRAWAAEDTTVQLTWGAFPPGPVQVVASRADDPGRTEAVATVEDFPGGPGSVVIEGLRPATSYVLTVTTSAGARKLEATTLASPPGPELARIATISDLHIGARRWGFLKTMVEDDTYPELHPTRCARAAITDAIAWGAELIVIKGDAAHHRHPDYFADLGRLLDEFPDMPMVLIPGNHDVDYSHSHVELPTSLGHRGIPYTRGVDRVEVDGLAVIVADTTIDGRSPGTLQSTADDLLDAASDLDRPALLATHHHFERHPVTSYWPPGISAEEAVPFLDRLSEVEPDVLVTSGHSHRNRVRHHRGERARLTVTEVASTRDWPGVWAGYAIHEGGIRQMVRRVSSPDAVEWHEYSRGALLGAWDFWSPGRHSDRCFSQRWAPAD